MKEGETLADKYLKMYRTGKQIEETLHPVLNMEGIKTINEDGINIIVDEKENIDKYVKQNLEHEMMIAYSYVIKCTHDPAIGPKDVLEAIDTLRVFYIQYGDGERGLSQEQINKLNEIKKGCERKLSLSRQNQPESVEITPEEETWLNNIPAKDKEDILRIKREFGGKFVKLRDIKG